jgi:ABC-type transporter Mla subunit MlaD
MQILRTEVRTGLLVLLTLGLVVGVVLYIASPGLFRPLKQFDVYFDNAAGIKPGAAVMLAGRKIGTVANIQSPVPLNDRPEHKLNYEAMVRVQVADDSQIYNETTVAMRSFGLLAELVIDFTNGNPESGVAEPGAKFVGIREPDLAEVGPIIIEKLEPALKQSEATLAELQRTSRNLTTLTAPDASLTRALKNFEGVGSNLKGITDKGGQMDSAFSRLDEVLSNVKGLTAQLQKDGNIEKVITNFKEVSAEFKGTLDSLNKGVGRVLSKVGPILDDLKELSAKLKEQPWRIVWPSTIKYPGPEQPGGAHVPARRRAEQ